VCVAGDGRLEQRDPRPWRSWTAREIDSHGSPLPCAEKGRCCCLPIGSERQGESSPGRLCASVEGGRMDAMVAGLLPAGRHGEPGRKKLTPAVLSCRRRRKERAGLGG
jgi:hypothetical protein